MSFSVVSTFSGCGGSSLGYQMADGKVRLAVEWDKNAVDTYRLNFPDTPIYHGDIAELTGEEALRLSGLRRGDLDVLDGSPPCQGFSTSGKRMYHDPRNSLFMEFARLIEVFRPKVLVMENVSGMVKGKMKILFAKILTVLKDSGYKVSARLLDAACFNVPQHRRRMIFIGVRNDLGIEPSHPKAQRAAMSLKETLRGVRNTDKEIKDSDASNETVASDLLRKMKAGEQGSKYHPRGSFYGLRRLKWDETPGTVQSQDGGHVSCAHCHPTTMRRLTIPELKRVASFPDDFEFVGKYKDQWARIGNSVPPNFMRAIAEHIRDEILAVTVNPSLTVGSNGK